MIIKKNMMCKNERFKSEQENSKLHELHFYRNSGQILVDASDKKILILKMGMQLLKKFNKHT